MTSYPPRIKYVARAFASILMTNIDKSLYHCVLVLSKLEFPNLEKDLPNDLNVLISNNLIEVIWTENNTKSHKKLMPTLKKYPNQPILVIDDDVIRTEEWLKAFIETNKKYPNDVICGAFYKKIYIKNDCIYEIPCTNDTYNTNKYANCIMNLYKPANGTGGTLYPANTFKDERFFDENLMLYCAETDDETWQYCFAILNNKKFRQLPYPHIDKFLQGSQENCLNKINTISRVQKFHKNICNAIPEFLIKLKELQ